MTTFFGHLNVYGVDRHFPFWVGPGGLADMNAMLVEARARNGFVSINHPALPNDARCKGCGWIADDTDYSLVDAVEVVNGGASQAQGGPEGPLAGFAFWHALLDAGHRIIGVGGSDNHDPTLGGGDPTRIGGVTTVIRSEGPGTPALLAGLRSGQVFIDLAERPDRKFNFALSHDGVDVPMGGALEVRNGHPVMARLSVSGCGGCSAELVTTGGRIMPVVLEDGAAETAVQARPGTWVRANVRDADGKLVLVGNPVWID